MSGAKWNVALAVGLAAVVWIIGETRSVGSLEVHQALSTALAVLLGASAVVAAFRGTRAEPGTFDAPAAGVLVLAAACILEPRGWAAPVALGFAVGLPWFASAWRGRAEDRTPNT